MTCTDARGAIADATDEPRCEVGDTDLTAPIAADRTDRSTAAPFARSDSLAAVVDWIRPEADAERLSVRAADSSTGGEPRSVQDGGSSG
ncbi:hypothetical protein C477_06876 [Haloterrigena salina JCM 13891]|uniref:Uncharacterized protein n=1 Tax=Haloterrigena salina JCM 13891 TaxID=1227488 RepID=M0CA08_9EURY|nr:hypothetical protein [Haloterrigena salina]ELZ20121.1 hypothetical protein C477_06876 [Haloterrigena salina JCM 13891]